jgi:TonB family protein
VLSDKIELESPVVEEDVTATTADEKEPAREAEEETAKWSDTADTIAVAEGNLAAVINKDAKALNFSITTTEEAGPEKDAQRTRSEHRSDNNLQNQVPEAGNGNEVVADLYKSEPPAELTEDAVHDLDLMEEVYNEEKEVHYEMQAGNALSGEEQLAKNTASTGKATKKNSKDGGDFNNSADKKKESTRTMAQTDEYDDPGTLYNAHVPTATAAVESTNYDGIAVPVDSISDNEQAPMFQGGELGLRQYLSDNLVYPDSAEKLGIEGRVHVSFNVNADSTISDAAIVKSIGGGCDEEAIRVVNEMPNWAPARKQGKIVSSQQELSIDFHPGTSSDKK